MRCQLVKNHLLAGWLVACTTISSFTAIFGQSKSTEKFPSATTVEKLDALLSDLGARDFATRVAASKQLKKVSPQQIQSLAERVADVPNAEVVIRILAEIDNRYSSEGTPPDVKVASVALEALAQATRKLVAQGAELSLLEHWEKRIDLAVIDLTKYGAVIKNGQFTAQTARWLPVDSSKSMQILINNKWHGGDAGLKAFERLSVLFGPMRVRRSGVSVFLIAGHSLSEAEQARLTEIVGQNRIAVRSRVALGITGNAVVAPGVLIDRVSAGSSAQAAGLKPGDMLLAIELDEPYVPKEKKVTDKADEGTFPEEFVPQPIEDVEGDEEFGKNREPLRDFDHLVERLMDYDKGDVMKFRVYRSYDRVHARLMFGRRIRIPSDIERGQDQQDESKIEVINVTLKGWEELKTN